MSSVGAHSDGFIVPLSVSRKVSSVSSSSHRQRGGSEQSAGNVLTVGRKRARRKSGGQTVQTVGRKRARRKSGGQTIKIIAVLLSAALSLCWAVAILLVFRQPDAHSHTSLHSLRHPLGSLRHDFELYRKGLEQKRKDTNVGNTRFGTGGLIRTSSYTGKLTPSANPDGINEMDSPILIFTCRRADYLRRSLTAIWEYHPINKMGSRQGEGGRMGFPIIVSQDGNDNEVKIVIDEFIRKFTDIGVPFFRTVHPKLKEGNLRGNDAYKALAVHFGWALRRLFHGDIYKEDTASFVKDLPLPDRVIILEEDIEIAPDFFSYMNAAAPLLDSDPTLFAVSAFNDNGKKGIVGDVKRIVRSDFFPGLGWMINRKLWLEIEFKWPNGWWDEWLRLPEQRQGRQVVRPEVSRTFHFGSDRGASYNQFGEDLLDIELDTADFDWEKQDLSYLERNKFREAYYSSVLNAEFSTWKRAMQAVQTQDVRVEYSNWKQFKKNVPEMLPLMTDEKAGVPRTAFEAIVETRPYGPGGHLMFLTPPASKLRENLKNGKSMTMMDFSESLRVVPPPEKR